jgi:hypothetical protein
MGFVYTACEGAQQIIRYNAEDPSEFRVISTNRNRGIGIDSEGRVWGITRHNGATASVITPGPTIDDNALMLDVGPSLNSPYTYSDMTGLQLRLATNPRGYYRHIFEGCVDRDETDWQELRWEVETPEGTFVAFRVRTANTVAELPSLDWTPIATAPPDTPPASITERLVAAGVTPRRFLELDAVLVAERSSFSEVITPRLRSMAVSHVCAAVLQ